tara:strand:+ start:314 stop:901 length:588 start_codon:yes stop_codon:yes gene_type:complete
MKKIFYYVCILSFIFLNNLKAQDDFTFGIDGGWGFLDLGADDTAQILANATSRTTSYTEDSGAFVIRPFIQYGLDENNAFEIGYFFTGDVSATYTNSSGSASEDYNASGFDLSYLYTLDEFTFKVGVHTSEVTGAATLNMGGTNVAVGGATSGSGALVGLNYNLDKNTYVGLQQYSNVGGDDAADIIYLSYGYKF